MSAADFQSRLKKLNEQHTANKEAMLSAQAPKRPSWPKSQILIIALIFFAGAFAFKTVLTGSASVASIDSTAEQPASTKPTKPPAQPIEVVDGVPYEQIKPETPIMKRLPESKNLFAALASKASDPAINRNYPAPDGWAKVSHADVKDVTPMQSTYLALDDLPPDVAIPHRAEMQLFAKRVTGVSRTGMFASLNEAVVNAPDVLFLSPKGARLSLNIEKFSGKLVAKGSDQTNKKPDTIAERFERQKWDGGSRRNFQELMVDGIKVAYVERTRLKGEAATKALKANTQPMKWVAFIMPDYNTQLKFEGIATYEEFTALIRLLGKSAE